MNLKAFFLLGLLFAVVLVSSVVTADKTSKDENTVVNEASTEMNPKQVEDSKQGGGGYCGRCCWIRGNHYCGHPRCCWPQKEESEVADEAAAYQVQPDQYGGGWGRGWGGYPGWGWGRGWGGYGPGGGWGRGWGGGYGPGGGWGRGWGGYGRGGGWGGWHGNIAGDDGRN